MDKKEKVCNTLLTFRTFLLGTNINEKKKRFFIENIEESLDIVKNELIENVTGPIITKTCEWEIIKRNSQFVDYETECKNIQRTVMGAAPYDCPYCKNKIVIVK